MEYFDISGGFEGKSLASAVSESWEAWSGHCLGNVAHGWGTIHLTIEDNVFEDSGEMAQGFKQGRWIGRTTRGPGSGMTGESHFLDSKKVGRETLRSTDGTVLKYPIIDGKPDWSRARRTP